MSGTTLVNFRLDQETKRSMEGVCHDLGMSMTTAFTLFAKKVDRERRIPFDVSLDGTPSPDVAQPVTIAANHADPAVIVEDVVRVFGEGATERRALDGASLTVRRGEFVAIMGPSGEFGQVYASAHSRRGGGLRNLGTRSRGRHGPLDARLQRPCALPPAHRRPRLSVPQPRPIPLRARQHRASRALRRLSPHPATIAELLELLDIADCEKSMPSELSGGQQQRVAIARALVSRPAVILADEPTGSLDRANGEKVVELLRRARERFGTTVVLVTHDEDVAAAADRVVRISDGRVVCGEE